jgi:tRNA threonylcarbamoyladenosine biosynthesis protein TsaE
MDDAPPLSRPVRITLGTAEDTTQLARWLGAWLGPGDTLLLEGPIGAGKSHFCRGLIQSRLAALGKSEDVPSPTFTLVQVYDAGPVEIWHADLYRLTGPDEVMELGLDQAFDTAICLVEWPDRLAHARPAGALVLRLGPGGGETVREAEFVSASARWTPVLSAIASGGWRGDD